MAVAGNTTGAGGTKNLAKVDRDRRRHRRAATPPLPKLAPIRGPLKPSPRVLAPAAPAPRPRHVVAPPARHAAAPSPAVKERHQRVAQRRVKYARQAEDVRQQRQLATPAPMSKTRPNFPSFVPSKPGELPKRPKLEPPVGHTLLKALDAPAKSLKPLGGKVKITPPVTLERPQDKVTPGTISLQRSLRQNREDAEVAARLDVLKTKGDKISLKRHETNIDRLRELNALPGSSRAQRALDKADRAELAARARQRAKEQKKPSGLAKTIGDVAHVAGKVIEHTPVSQLLNVGRAAQGVAKPTVGALAEKAEKATAQRKRGRKVGAPLATLSFADQLLSGQLTPAAIRKFAGKYNPLTGALRPVAGAADVVAGIAGRRGKPVGHFLERASENAADVVTNAIPSLYVPAKQLAEGKNKEAAKDFAKSYTEIYHHPGREFSQRPVTSALSLVPFLGVGKLAGGAGRLAIPRTAEASVPGRVARAVGSTKRESLTVPNTRTRVDRQYSPNALYKIPQAVRDRALERRNVRKGRDPHQMTPKQIKREVSGAVLTERNVQSLGERETAVETQRAAATGRRATGPLPGGKGLRRATAAHTLYTQGFFDGTKPGLEKFLGRVQDAAKGLEGDPLRENQALQKDVQRALKKWHGKTEGQLRKLGPDYRKLDEKTTERLVKANVLTREEAERTRWIGPAVHHGLHDPEGKAGHLRDAEIAVERAGREKRAARTARDRARAGLRETELKTKVAELRAGAADVEPVRAAIKGHAVAKRDLRRHERGLENEVVDASTELNRATEAARRGAGAKRTPQVVAAEGRVRALERDLGRQEREALSRERISGRQEGRAQVRVGAEDRVQTKQLSAAERDAGLARERLKTEIRQLRDARTRGADPRKITEHEDRVKAAGGESAKAEVRREALARVRRGTHPTSTLEALERRGGEDLAHAQARSRTRVELDAAREKLRQELARSEGVPEAQADRLRRALERDERARHAHRTRAGLDRHRVRVDETGRALEEVKGRYKLRPEKAERLWKAMHAYEEARLAHGEAVRGEHAAHERGRGLREADFVDPQGRPVTVAQVAARQRELGMPEPSYLPHTYAGEPKGVIPESAVRLGTHEREGQIAKGLRMVASPEQLLGTRLARSRTVNAAEARGQAIETLGYRPGPDQPVWSTKLRGTETEAGREGAAVTKANQLNEQTGQRWVPIKNQHDENYSLIPAEAMQRLRQHVEVGKVRGPLDWLGRRWRSGILSVSTKWLTGQYVEGLLRLAVQHGFNPASVRASNTYVDEHVRQLHAAGHHRDAAQLEAIYKRGSVGREAEATRRSYHNDLQMIRAVGDLRGSLRDLYREGGAELAGQRLRAMPGIRHLGSAVGAYQNFVFHSLNGHFEQAVRKPMLGKIMRDHPELRDQGMPANLNAAVRSALRIPVLQDRGLPRAYQAAVEDALQGRYDTPAINALTRKMHEAFGQYQGRSPWAQTLIEGYTPFIPWFLNAVKFLGVVMPRDHPIMSALVADSNRASEEWRRKYGLVYSFDPNSETSLPAYKQGSLPIAGQLRNITHYTPMGAGQGIDQIGEFFLPQFQTLIHAAMEGEDWRGHKLGTDSPFADPSAGRKLTASAWSMLELLLPPLGMAEQTSGLSTGQAIPGFVPPNLNPPADDADKLNLGHRIQKQFWPLNKVKGLEATPTSAGGVKLRAAPGVKLKPGAGVTLKSGAGVKLKKSAGVTLK